ncbi:MAG: ABC transporter ATP-binding protein, partial [Hyphomicrobiales bacterium]|nr:ABC transporter ATP-binding protein [Hyphomicrobiales bacterium]
MAALATARREDAPPVAGSLAIDIRDLSHAFTLHGSTLPVLDTINFTVAAGEFVALLGASGC